MGGGRLVVPCRIAVIVCYAVAYRGDVLPLAPIAWELSRRGHEVRFVAPEELHPIIGRHGVTCFDADEGDLSPSGLDRHADFIARWGMRAGGAMTVRLYIRDLCGRRLPQLTAAVDTALGGTGLAQADLVIAHPAATLISRISAEARGVPWVTADMIPVLIPTGDHPPDGFGVPNRWPGLNRFLWRRAAQLSALLGGERMFRDARTARGLPTPKGYVFNGRISPLLHLGLVSEHYVPSPSDLPSYHPTGFTPWTTPTESMPADVEAFLDEGEPPVLVTFGTSAASAAPQLFGMVAEALDRLGLRGLYLTGTEANAKSLAGRPGIWPFVPIGPVLARCRAAVQSGAHGTNALILEAGVPSVVVPQLFDQIWHGRRITELGVGRLVRKPDVDSVTDAIHAIVGDPTCSARALALARLLADEDGSGTAADLIEAELTGARRQLPST